MLEQHSFAEVRERLERQYEPMALDSASGYSREQLTRMIAARVQAWTHEPLMTLRAELLELILTQSRIGLDEFDLFADHIDGRRLLAPLRAEAIHRAEEKLPEALRQELSDFAQHEIFHMQVDQSHTSPDWKALLDLGPTGLIQRAEEALKQTDDPEATCFLAAVIRVYEAMLTMMRRFADLARRRQMTGLADTLDAIVAHPPQTLRQALQLALFYDTCQEIEMEPVRSQGLFDRLFYPFYRRDVEAGRLTREDARELLMFYWTKFYAQRHPNGKNFCFGGLLASGQDGCNELTGLCFAVHQALNRVNPKLSFRVHRGTPEGVFHQLAECVCSGRTAVVFSNDDRCLEMLSRGGKDAEDAYDYLLIGCYEPSVMGLEMCCSMSAYGSLVRPLEAVFNDGCTFDGVRVGPSCSVPLDYRGFEAEYFRQLDSLLVRVMDACRQLEPLWCTINPSPLLSGTMSDCIRSGRDVSAGGARYNSSGVMCAGFGTVVDSLAAIRFLVDERSLCSVSALGEILRHNWAGQERLRMIAQRGAPTWGNGEELADGIARRLARRIAARVNSTPNTRGGHFQTGLWSINYNLSMGRQCPATPNGRLAGDPISRNMSCSPGRERQGALALMRSMSSLDLADAPDGAVLDVMLHPSMVSGAQGADVLMGLVRGFFAGGGLMVQFNILDAEALKRAQADPDGHSDLQVRVCGWNSRFVDLSPEEQQGFINQAEAQG